MKIVERKEVRTEDTWDLLPLYADEAGWRADLDRLKQELNTIAGFRGTLGQSPQALDAALRAYLDMGRRLEKVYVFAHLKSDEDTTNSTYLGMLDEVGGFYARFAGEWSFLNPELLALPEKTLELLVRDPLVADLSRLLSEIVRYKPHTLSRDEEQLLALGSEVFGSADKIYSQLNNADLEFGAIDIDGNAQPLTHGSYQVFLRHKERGVRERAFTQYYEQFHKHRHTIAATLAASVKRDVYLARVRKHTSARAKSLFSDNVPETVYDALVDTISTGLDSLHRYYSLRKKVLRLADQRTFDTYVPLVEEVKTEYSFEAACEMVLDSLAPLGAEYTDVLRGGFTTGRWVDRYENKGKRSGAYSSGCYDSPPYILMNYKAENLHDMFTLTHEAGHSMHSYYSCRTQPYQDHGYTIFVAEVASTFNEQLLMKHLRELHRDDRRMQAYLVNQAIDDIKGTFFRQTMFAEFERIIHAASEQDRPLTVENFTNDYRALLEKYFGSSVVISELDALECFRIPHFYSAFYVYKYATGIAAAISLSEKVLSGDTSARERYLSFLKAGGSKFPLELLRDAGVDMESPEPIRATLRQFGSLVETLEGLLH